MKSAKMLSVLALVLGLVGTNAVLAQTSTVSPSGDTSGTTDWQNMMNAFSAAGPGSTVQLAAGTFYLHKSIVVPNFSGTFKGAGKTATIIQTAPGVAFDSDSADFIPSMLIFEYDSDPDLRILNVSDMKLHVTELTVEYIDHRRPYTLNVSHGLGIYNDSIFDGGVSNVNATVENVDIEGTRDLPGVRGFYYGQPYDWKNNIFGGLAIWLGSGPSTCLINNCHILNVDIGINTWTMSDAVLTGNTVENGNMGLECLAGDSQVISGNTFLNCRYALYLYRCNGFHIESNIIACPIYTTSQRQYQYGINLQDYCLNATIIGNRILRTAHPDGRYTSYRYPIELTGSPNSIISDNKVEGYRYAIMLDRWNDNCIVSGNTASVIPPSSDVMRSVIAAGHSSEGVSIFGNSISGTAQRGVYLNYCKNYIVSDNIFSGCDFRDSAVFVLGGLGDWFDDGSHSILRNDYTNVGSPGWACVTLSGSHSNLVSESGWFPPGTGGAKTNVVEYVDFGSNRIIGHPANHVSDPGIGQQLQQIAAELEADQAELEAESATAEEDATTYP